MKCIVCVGLCPQLLLLAVGVVAVVADRLQQAPLVRASFSPLSSPPHRQVFQARASRAINPQLGAFAPIPAPAAFVPADATPTRMSSGIAVAPGSASAFLFTQNPAPAASPSVPVPEAVPAPSPDLPPVPDAANPSLASPAPVIPLLRRTEVHDEAGQYALGFETGNGITVSEQGALKKNVDGEWKDDFVLVKQGSISYLGPDGRTYTLTYTADENGFHPTASYLPVAPSPVS